MNPAYAARRLAQEASVALNSRPGEKRIFTKAHQGGWGRNWFFTKTNPEAGTASVSGCLTPLPRVDDEFHSAMRSGKVGIFRVAKVEYCRDPHDMFFADVVWIDYAP